MGSGNPERILIATDGSPGSLAAVEEGVRLAKLLGAEVIFTAVAHSPLPILGDPYLPACAERESRRDAEGARNRDPVRRGAPGPV